MNSTQKIHFFSYKSAFVFFGFILVFNLVFNPMLYGIGIDKKLSLLLVNTVGISAGLTLVVVFIEGKLKNKKKSFLFFLFLLLLSSLVCFSILYR